VRLLAEQRHVDIATVNGTGPDATITRADVEAAAAAVTSPPTRQAPPPAPAPAPQRPAATTGVRASPLAKRRAAELGIDLRTIVGTGPGGAISDADVETAAGATSAPSAAAPSATAPSAAAAPIATGRADRSAAMRHATGVLMARSKREIPHYYLTTEIDLHHVRQWLNDTNAGRPVQQRLVPSALLLKAAAAAARRVPEVNGFWNDDAFTPASSVHLGVAISMREGGLIAPAIHDADTLTVDEQMERLRDLVTRARTGRLRQSEMADSTLTVTNLGDLGVGGVYGVIYPPQVALVGFGRVTERPWAIDGMLAVRPVVTATLAADHRASDGHRGGRYLARVDELLQRPEEL
jgi:pyruvate dehydrogenase E2 component (dihydrolipoamide acetyltransferase)